MSPVPHLYVWSCLRAAAAIALVLSAASSTQAAWEHVPLPRLIADATALSIAPTNPSRLYMGLYRSGIVRTDNRGTTWIVASGGLPLGASVETIETSPVNADRAWAGIETVWRTTNAGASWIPANGIPTNGGASIRDILVHSGNPSILHAATSLSPISWQLVRSTDGGANWSPTGVNLNAEVFEVEASSANPDLILAATSNGVARSTDAGVTWTPGNGLVLTAIEIAESDGNRVYARRDLPYDTFYRSTNGGIAFTSMGEVWVNGGDVLRVAVHPTNKDMVAIATTNDGGLPEQDPQVKSSTDGGDTWNGPAQYYTNSGLPTGLLYDPTNASHLYLAMSGATFGHGFLHSSNAGANWTVKIEGIHNYSISPLRGTPAGWNIAEIRTYSGLFGLFRSPSDLDVWEGGPASGYWPGGGMLEVTETPGLLWSTGQIEGMDHYEEFVIRSTNSGSNWWPTATNLPPGLAGGHDFHPSRMVANHGDGSTAYISGYGGVYRSTNVGESWNLVNASASFLDGVVDPNDADRLFVTGIDPPVQLSTDGAVSFAPRSSGLPAGTEQNHVDWIFMRRADPDYLEVVYSVGQVWETFDAGLSWSLRSSLDVQDRKINDVTWDEATGEIFAAVNGLEGVVDPIVSTHPLFEPSGLPAIIGTAVHWDAAKSTLLAGAGQTGLWQQTIASAVDAPLIESAAGLELLISPNPSSSASSVRFQVPHDGAAVRAEVFDTAGRRIRRLVDANLPGGVRELIWDGKSESGATTSSGVYFVRVRMGGSEGSARIVRIP